jgi:hypothetical protein
LQPGWGLLKEREVIITRKYSSANGGIIVQMSAEEGSVCQLQEMDGLQVLSGQDKSL